MKKFFKKLSLVPKGLRYKLMMAFTLMSIIPILVAVYLTVNYIFPVTDTIGDISIVIVLTIVIAVLGLVLARKLVEPVIDMALEAKIIAGGRFDRKISAEGDDEIGELGNAINEMTKKIRANLDELSSYGERTKEINLEIHKKVLTLSSLLQVGDAITAATLPLNDILNLISEKVAQAYETSYTLLLAWEDEAETVMAARSFCNLPTEKLKEIKIGKTDDFLERLIKEPKMFSIDKDVKLSKEADSFLSRYGFKNVVIAPVISRRKLAGFLLVGNQLEDFKYKDDDVELYKLFSRQIAIAMENDYLFKRTKELTVTDDLTGLFNKRYIATRLEEEIKRSILFQRPCSFIVIDVDDSEKIKKIYDEISVEKALKRIADILKKNITAIGKAARLGAYEFALLLPETNKKGAAKIAEDIRKIIEESFLKKLAPEDIEKLTVSIGVSENPIDGSKADELIAKATKAVAVAKSLGKNKVVAHIGG